MTFATLTIIHDLLEENANRLEASKDKAWQEFVNSDGQNKALQSIYESLRKKSSEAWCALEDFNDTDWGC